MIIDFEQTEHDFYLNIEFETGYIFILDNKYNEKSIEISLDNYNVFSNNRYSKYTIPTSLFDDCEVGQYHYRVINEKRKRLISSNLTIIDKDFIAVNYDKVLNNLEETTNKPTIDFNETLNDLFD